MRGLLARNFPTVVNSSRRKSLKYELTISISSIVFVFLLSTGQNNVLWETPAAREGTSTLVHTFYRGPCSGVTNNRNFCCCFQFPVVLTTSMLEFHHRKDSLVHLVAVSSTQQTCTSSARDRNLHISCLKRKRRCWPQRYYKSHHVTASFKWSTF